MGKTNDRLKEEYSFVQEKFKAKEEFYLKYLLAFAFKGQRNFETKIPEVIRIMKEVGENGGGKESRMMNFEKLTNLDGVGFPTASTILHFLFPDSYAIIDQNVLIGIEKEEKINLGKLEGGQSNDDLKSNVLLYERYIDFLEEKLRNSDLESLRKTEEFYFEKGRLKNDVN